METMGLEGGICLQHKMTPPPNLGHFWVVFLVVVPNFAFNKNQAKLAAGANRGHMEAHEQVPALICDTFARRIKQNWLQQPIEGTWKPMSRICDTFARCILCAPTIWGG